MATMLTTKLPTDAELRKMFDAVPALEKHRVADATVRAGIKPVTTRARMLIPRSKASDRAKRSAKQKRENPGLDSPLWKTVKHVVRKGERAGAVAVSGPEFTGSGGVGQKIYLIAEHKKKGRRVFYWGRDAGITRIKIRNVMVQAAEETRPEQLAAMKAMLKRKLDEVWRG